MKFFKWLNPHCSTLYKNYDPCLKKQDAKYRKFLFVEMWVYYSIYKSTHGANFLTCNEPFVIRKSIVSFVLHEFVYAFNSIHKGFISWHRGVEMLVVMKEFTLQLNVSLYAKWFHHILNEFTSPTKQDLMGM